MGETLERRIAARPADAVEHDVALTHGSDKSLRSEPRQEHAMLGRAHAERCEGSVEPVAKQAGDVGSSGKFYEAELAIAHFARDAGKDGIELRQIFAERLAAPVNRRGATQSQLGPLHDGGGRYRGWLIVDRQIWQPHQAFRIVILRVR